MSQPDHPPDHDQVESISPETLRRKVDDGKALTILDTRIPEEYDEWHIDGENVTSINIPYFELLGADDPTSAYGPVPRADPVVVLCAEGDSSAHVSAEMEQMGYDVKHLTEGMEGWATIYDRIEVTRYTGAGTLYQYQRYATGCLGYLLVDDGEAAVIDPLRAFTERYLDDAAKLDADLIYALDTHVHADHVSGVRDLAAEGVEGIIPEASVQRGVTYADEMTLAADGDQFQVGNGTIEAIYTPGHTTGMTSYLIDESLLTTGDGLFVESVARPDLEDGDEGAPRAARMLHETLQERILTLPNDTLIGGGHYSEVAEPAEDGTYTAPLGTLIDRMDALSMDEEAFVERVLADMPPRPANYEEIIPTNLGQLETDEEEAFELELGPNNCAASKDSLATG